jgi:hypothetical protein
MAKIRQSNLDNSIVTGLGELTSVASGDQTIVYDASSGTLKKISQINLLNSPTVSSVSPTSVTSGDGTGNYTFTIIGSSFTGASASLVNTSGTTVNFDTVTIDSDTQITGVIAKSSLPGSGEPYDIKVIGSNNIASVLADQINIDQSPTYNTASGSIGTVADANRGSTTLTVEAFDPESAGNVTYEIQSGSLPAGASIATVHENGVSKANISGFSAVGSDTTSNFVLRAVDTASNTSSRSFSITVEQPLVQTFTSSGTYSVPSGVSAVDVLLVAGGGGGGNQHGSGGGAGGLIFMPGYPVTPGGTVSVTVGTGGNGGGSGGTPGQTGSNSVFGTLTAEGGGKGAGDPRNACTAGGQGGSGGGGSPVGQGTQPTQPNNNGAYGFGNNGGGLSSPSPGTGGGGGGGAGAAGGGGTAPGGIGGPGGAGRAYTIADNSTPVFYAGGGGGASHSGQGCTAGTGGQGGGGDGGGYAVSPAGVTGTANRGGGGGGSGSGPVSAGQGGKGVVIVRWT